MADDPTIAAQAYCPILALGLLNLIDGCECSLEVSQLLLMALVVCVERMLF